MTVNELETFNDGLITILRRYHICLHGLRNVTETPHQDSRYSGHSK